MIRTPRAVVAEDVRVWGTFGVHAPAASINPAIKVVRIFIMI